VCIVRVSWVSEISALALKPIYPSLSTMWGVLCLSLLYIAITHAFESYTVDGDECLFRIDVAVKFTSFDTYDYPHIIHSSNPPLPFAFHGMGPAYKSNQGKVGFYVQTLSGIGANGRGVGALNVGPLAVNTWYRVVAEKLPRTIRLTYYDYDTGLVIESVTSAELDSAYTNAQFCTKPFVPFCLACGSPIASSLTMLGEAHAFVPAPTTAQLCPLGKYSPDGATNCQDCAAGSYGAFEGMLVCQLCPAGTALNTVGATSVDACEECPAGTRALTGYATCAPCATGKYASAAKTQECAFCPAGKYSDTLSASICTDCAPGRSVTSAGSVTSTACTACAAGKYSNNGSLCTACPAGTVSPLPSAGSRSNCTVCAAGTYAASSGRTACTLCPANTYTANTNSTVCLK